MISSIRVIGLGKVGELVATLLMDSGFAVKGVRRARNAPTCRSRPACSTYATPTACARRSRAATPSSHACRTTFNLGVAEAATRSA